MIQYTIYMHTSIKSGKSYVGLTGRSVEARWKEHCRCSTDCHFHNAIKLYGVENWTHEVLRNDIDTLEEAQALEKYYIKKFDTFENGYNSTLGGEGVLGLNPFKNMSKEAYSKHCKDTSIRQREFYDTKEYTFYNPELGIKETMTAVDLADKYKLHQGYVRYVAQGKSKHCNGWFLWKGDDIEYSKDPIYKFEHKKYGVEKLTLKEMSKKYNLSKGNLCMVVKGQRSHTKGWTIIGNLESLNKKRVPGNAKPVQKVDIITNEVVAEYPSVSHAARENSLSESIVGDRCRGRCATNSINGFKFQYKDSK